MHQLYKNSLKITMPTKRQIFTHEKQEAQNQTRSTRGDGGSTCWLPLLYSQWWARYFLKVPRYRYGTKKVPP